jgi:fatty acid desaturase
MDYAIPREFETAQKESLQNSVGVRFQEFCRTLTPKYATAWLRIGCGYLVLLLTALCIVWWGDHSTLSMIVSIVVGGGLFGYTIAFLQLFLHEAAHYNLASNRKLNDLLTNIFIGWLVGQDIRNYRPIHWGHHKWIGTPMDTEFTYFDPLDMKFMAEALFGIRVWKVLVAREKTLQSNESSEERKSMIGRQLVLGAAIHGVMVIGSFVTGYYALTLSWIVGMFVVFPFFASIRQLLEHRDENARTDVDYRKIAHGIVNRMFGDGILAATLGGAGFNRHLLHHWQPHISYTRLKELEAYLMDTPLASALKTRQTTYIKTFIRLFSH